MKCIAWFGLKHTKILKQREKRIKEWRRIWKIELIERDNPHWLDLSPQTLP
jgi:putative endonuclease